ncbi:hypothetical protein [Umboniibacter marinipuniceus]|uniref:Putative exporter n=1 Tax=Umboniibacter marinipuniceus TaxID=569599 RepID=A0A3M0ABE1_9GAMM|nr:hypothetical protein [Umboniibacter marinipuniceus]RMA82483.1 putative exporter [Umboniibacter marinipuniceus]
MKTVVELFKWSVLPLLILAALWTFPPKINTDVLALVPDDSMSEPVRALLSGPSEKLSSTVYVLIAGVTREHVGEQANNLLVRAQRSQLFQEIIWQRDATALATQYQQLQAIALNFSPAEQFIEGEYGNWLLSRWFGFETPVGVLQQDPLQIDAGINHFFAKQLGDAQMVNNAPYFQRAGEWATLLQLDAGRLAGSIPWQQDFNAWLEAEQSLAEVGAYQLLAVGSPRYAFAAMQQAKGEVSTIGVASLLAIVSLLLLVFRRPYLIAVVFYPLALGTGVALLVTQFIFGQIHLLTTVFGACLLGVSVDYSFHWLFAKSKQREQRISGLLALSAASSILVFLAQALSPYEALAQMGVFSAVGLAVAGLVVIVMFPRVVTSTSSHFPRVNWQRFPSLSPKTALVAAITAILLLLVIIISAPADDDVRKLQPLNKALQQEQLALGEWLSIDMSPRAIIVSAPSEDELLTLLQATQSRAEQLTLDEDFAVVSNLANVVLPRREQQRRIDALRNWLAHEENLTAVESAVGIDLNILALNERVNALEVLSLDDLSSYPLLEPWALSYYHRLTDDGALPSHYGAIFVTASATAWERLVSADWHQDVLLIDRADAISASLKLGREFASYLFAVALILLAALLIWKQGWRSGILRLGAAATGAVAGLLALYAADLALNVFSVLSLLLVLGLGVDFALFVAARATYAVNAVVCSAVTSILAFGLLALSAVPVLSSIGLIIAVGISVAFLAALMLSEQGANNGS